MAKRKRTTYTWEDVGGVTPQPIVPINEFNPEYSSPRQKTLSELFPEVTSLSPIKGFVPEPPVDFKTPEDYTRDAIKEKELPFSQRAGASITNFLLGTNLYNTSAGDAIQELGTPIVSGVMRMYEGGQKNNLPEMGLGLAGSTFGALMSPFTAIRMGTEKVAGETAGTIAEVGSMAFTGGLPMVAGYLASTGASELAGKVSEGLELNPKEQETVQEVTGLMSFILGVKGAEKFGKKINTELGKKVKSYIDELPEGFADNVFRKGEGESVPTGTYKDLLKGQDQQRIIQNPPEKRAYQEPSEVINVPTEIITSEGIPNKLLFNETQIRDRIKELDNEVRKAEKEGNEALYNELQAEKKKWQDRLPEKPTEQPVQEIIKPEEQPISKREQQKKTLYDTNKEVIFKILDENKGLLTEREISSKLNNLIDEGKLKKKVSAESIKKIKEEWRANQPKPEKQIIKSTPNELGIKTPNENNSKYVVKFDKNAGMTLKGYIEKYPEIKEKIKDIADFEQVKDIINEDWVQRREIKPQEQVKEKEVREPNETETGIILDEFGNTGFTFRNNIDQYIRKLKDTLSRPDFDKYDGSKRKLFQEEINKLEEIKSQGYTNLVDYAESKIKEPLKTKPKEDINKPAKDLLEKTQQKENFPENMWDEIFGKPQTREEILRDLDKAKREGLNNVGSIAGAVNIDILKGYAKLGAITLRDGAKTFDAWSKKMIEDLGEDVRPYLRELYNKVQENVKIDDKKILEYLNNPEIRREFNLELKEIEGKIIDPNTGKEGSARHKAGRNSSTIEFNKNTQGETWYHEFAHVVNNKFRQQNPNFLEEFRGEIEKLTPDNIKPINERFSDAFVEMFTNPNAPRTRLANILESAYRIPKSYDLARRSNKELGFEKLPEREAGVREEKSLDWLDQKYDAPVEVNQTLAEARNTDLYKELRDDGTQTFQEVLKESARLTEITEQKLLDLDPKTLNGKVFNKAQQVKIDQIAVNKALQVAELRKTFGEKLSTEQARQLEVEMLNLIKLQALVKNNLREAARVMESARRKNKLSPEEYEMVQKVANEIDKANQNTNLTQRVKRLEELTDPTLKDKLQYAWYNLALSNPLTDVANLGGNISSATFVMLAHPISGTKAFKKAYIDGLAFQNAYKILKGEQHTISKYTEESATKRDIINPKSKLGNILKGSLLPTERLKVEDALFRTFFEEIAKEKTAKIRAKELNVDKKNVLKIYNDLINNKNSIDALVTTWGDKKFIKDVEGIERWASKMVFQEPLGEMGRTAQKWLNLAFPLNLLTIPFLRIAVNMGKLGLDASPYGLAKLGARKIKQHFGKDVKDMTEFERKDLFQRAVMGTAFYGALTAILQDGTIELTGEAPRDKNIRDLWTKSGYQENSFIINNKDGSKTNISFNNVTPFNVILGGIGTLMTKAKFGKQQDKSVDADALDIVLGMANALGNQSFLQRSSQLLDILNEGDGGELSTYLMQSIPAPAILSLTKGSTDLESLGIGEAPTIYDQKSITDVLKNKYGITGDLTPKSGVFGEDRKSTYQRFPIPTRRETDKIAKFMLENELVIDDPSKPKEGGKEIFTDEEYDRYNKLYRRNFYATMNQQFELLNKIKQNEQYGQIMIEKIVSQIKEQARELAKLKIKEKK